jgi:internalin A
VERVSQTEVLELIARAKAENWKKLDLAGMELMELPAAIGELVGLEELILGKFDPEERKIKGNRLTVLPAEIGQLQNLTQLSLSSNQLKELPSEIGQLQNLTQLYLSSNQLKELPSEILQLQNLTQLYLSSNQLKELPSEILQLQNLTQLSLSFNQLKKLPSEIVQLQNLTQLYLSFNQLKELPSEIVQLHNLTQLDLINNQLKELPSEIVQLHNLTQLSLSSNQLKELPSEIGQLQNLTQLSLSSNQLKELPSEIGQLQNLTQLSLSSNQLKELPSEIGQLQNLTQLSLSFNQLKELPSEIVQLQNLTQLDLSSNQLKELPSEILQLQNLTQLYLSSNQLKELPSEIVQLQNLTQLDLSSNQLKELPSEILQLHNLTQLYLSFNQLKELPSEILQLQNLTQLDLSFNQLKALPEFIKDLANLEQLHLRGNPLPIPPELLVGEYEWEAGDLSTILDFYFNSPDLPESDPLYEAKLLIIGEGGAGKTSLAKKLLDPDYELQTDEQSTEGIEVMRWEFPHPDDRDLRLNIWDFGGQEIYHATHQFFLTERSLYVLVADTRKEEINFYYWLKIVELLSDNSPILIVKNEKQNRQCQIDDRALRGEFTNLTEILATDLANNRGLDRIKTAIQHHASNLKHIGIPLPGKWVRIRSVLENYAQNCNYISLDEYIDLCQQNGFSDEKRMLAVSRYLHDLGVCLHFQKVPSLRKTVILKPAWATSAVYKVLDTETVKNDCGRFTHDDLETIWDEGDTAKMRYELLQLMMEFELCYEIPHCKGRYIAPQLLQKGQPAYHWEEEENLILRYFYEFKPKDILPRFIVATHEMIEEKQLISKHGAILDREDKQLVWKHGVILTNGYARAEVIEEDRYHKAEIRIRVSGSNKRHLLAIVAHELEKIQNTYDRLEYQTLIPCNCSTCKGTQKPHTYSWRNLQRRLQNKIYEVQCEKSYAMINVRNLLDDVIERRPFNVVTEMGFKGEPYQQRSPYDRTSVVVNIDNKNTPRERNYNMSETHIHQHGTRDNYAGDRVEGDKIGTQIINNPELAQTAQDFKALIEQFAEEYNPNTEKGQKLIQGEVIEAIAQNSSLKQRMITMFKNATEAAIEEFVKHPAAKICIAGVKGLIEGKAE